VTDSETPETRRVVEIPEFRWLVEIPGYEPGEWSKYRDYSTNSLDQAQRRRHPYET
jgi:hypothetical protein